MIQFGSTSHFVVSYDNSFNGQGGNPNGPALAQGVLDYCEYDLVRLSMLFGNIMPTSFPIQINLVPGAGGANNNLLNTINLFCGSNTEAIGLPAIVVAEAAEIFMALQNRGWNAAWSNGEALSRVCAQILYPNRAWLWSTGDSWLSGDPGSPNAARSNWVDNVWHTDQDFVSMGCGSLFLNYLAYQLNQRWTDIIAAGAPNTSTLAETATALGISNAWTNFLSLINANLPVGSSLPAQPTAFGQQAEPTDNPFPFGALPSQVPILYTRHNLADTGTSHTGSLSDSPDIIVKNNPVSNPQATFSTAASIASDTESDPFVLTGQDNFVYLRVWNRGSDAANVFATVYWAPPSTLVTPNAWNLIGSAYYPDVPAGSMVEISNPGITWPSDRLPTAGHDCFVATVGNTYAPAPNSGSFATFDDFMNYIYANNNITWRNFNVMTPGQPFPWRLPFKIAGAWDRPRLFALEVHADLPRGSGLELEIPESLGKPLSPIVEKKDRRILLPADGTHRVGEFELPAKSAAASHLLVEIPAAEFHKPHKVSIRQLYKGREAGRITWLLRPKR